MRNLLSFITILVFVCYVSADIYLHAPRGSNNHLLDRNLNDKRLFRSENNNAGGYLWAPSMTYYSGSLLQFEWTAQHGCGVGHTNVDCNIVIQYMCGPWIRDGESAQRIDPDDPDEERGLHEPIGYYQDCRRRQRNLGLFLATRNIGTGQPATRTRQNAGGTEYGTECPEEGAYYPYFHPTPWRDIAILTSHTSRCGYYKRNSQNVAPKHHCVDKASSLDFSPGNSASVQNIFGRYPTENLMDNGLVPNNKAECEALGHKWEEVPSWGISAPDCIPAFYARDNHLGNSYIYGELMTNVYKWKVPRVPFDDPSESKELRQATCVVRVRYNITTEDWPGFGEVDGGNVVMDSSYNEEFRELYGSNGNDPVVQYGTDSQGRPRNLTLNVNFAQFGRTFQDRSHVMYIKDRPSNIPAGARIYNLNVRGRRGNIVQSYPSVEHDFTPHILKINKDDYIHAQWTGAVGENGAGNGINQREYHNIVFIKDNNGRKNWPEDINKQKLFDTDVAYELAHLNQPEYCNSVEEEGCCYTNEQLYEKHGNNRNNQEQDPQNCFFLNSAPRHFSLILKPKATGTFHFMSTRNNDFTNRSHKGVIDVSMKLSPVAIAGIAIGAAAFLGAGFVAFSTFYARSSDDAPEFFSKIKV